MEAIVLAGGFGTRLKDVIAATPKSMAPIRGRPFLEILLGMLAAKKVQHVVLALGYMAETIRAHFGGSYAGLQLDYVIEEKPLGTGGAARLAMARCSRDHLFVFNGDTYLDLEIAAVEQLWQQRHAPIIVGREVPRTERYGRLIERQGRVVGFAEKDSSGPGVINAGCYVFNRGQLDAYALNIAFSLERDYLGEAVARERFDLFMTRGQFIDIGTPEDLARAQQELA
jgi:D-glycero-alpha-D-manno-heptose 1-phosphate guanylyltransferase